MDRIGSDSVYISSVGFVIAAVLILVYVVFNSSSLHDGVLPRYNVHQLCIYGNSIMNT